MGRGIAAALVAALVWVAVAAAAPGDPKRAFTAADQAYARSFLLLRSDLPGSRAWHAQKTDFSQPNPPCFVRHYSLAALTETGEAGFQYSLAGGVAAESGTHVLSTAAQGARAYATVSTIGAARCFGTTLAEQVRRSSAGLTVRLAGIRRIALPGTARAYRVSLRLHSSKGSVTLDLVIANARRGRALAALSFIGPGGLWKDALVRRLTGKVTARMKR